MRLPCPGHSFTEGGHRLDACRSSLVANIVCVDIPFGESVHQLDAVGAFNGSHQIACRQAGTSRC